MNAKIKKTLISGLAVLTVAAGLATASAPAQAGGFNPWPFVAVGAAGFVVGTLAAQHPVYVGRGYCGQVREKVYDAYGDFAGYRWVSTC